MRLRAILALAAAGVAALLFAPGAQAAAPDYPPSICATLSLSTTAPLPGEQITVSGSDFRANASVRLELHSAPIVLKTVTTDSTGSFSTLVTLPSDVSGTHTIVAATGFGSGGTCPPPSISFQIGGQSSSNGGGHHGGTSGTGEDILIMLIAAAVLIAGGVAFNRSGKARRNRQTSSV